MLEWLSSQLNDEELERLNACMEAFSLSNPDRNQLRQHVERVQDLEKRFVGLNPTQAPPEDLRERILVCSVGMRPLPVILSTLLLQPKKLYLLHSQESRTMAEQVRDDIDVQSLGLHPIQDIVLRSISLTNAPENYGHLQRIVNEDPGEEFIVDISGGVKVMGVSLAAAAFWLRIPVIYQLGEEIAGTIKPFSEQLTELQNPFVYFGSTELRGIQELFDVGEYDAALSLCKSLRETVGDVQTLGKLEILHEFVLVYRDWDAFSHSQYEDTDNRRLATRFRVVKGKMKRLGLSFAPETTLNDNLEFLDHLEKTWSPLRNNCERFRLIDIYASSRRRGKAGKYDDAVARLYRCLEMSATIVLLEDCKINNVDQSPDLSYFIQICGGEQELRKKFKDKANYDLPQDRFGLHVQMTLLSLSGENSHRAISGNYLSLEKDKLMAARNRSILAHGTVPVRAEDYRKFDQKTRRVIEFVFEKGEFDSLLAKATHPHIIVEL